MKDKLAEEILVFFELDCDWQGGYIYYKHEVIRAMQAYHESKLRESKIVESFERENQYVTDEDIEAYFKTWQNPRIKTADEQYEQWLNRYLEELIDSAIEGAKAMRDGKIKHIEKK